MPCSTLEMSMGYIMVMISQILASILTAIISVYVIIKCSRLFFHINCKILIYFMLWLYFAHSLAYGGPQVSQLKRHTSYFIF
ncbi:unnamed protein product [Cylicocyclus nassatus]|uniref:Uncharacterized protein n=1 Tax=Cylicocyclus nassatus TaxID=53992 RepID=A0AA36MDL8_CYLNA|nr:unnamed protein product [Cylicocyclus nassatus]